MGGGATPEAPDFLRACGGPTGVQKTSEKPRYRFLQGQVGAR